MDRVPEGGTPHTSLASPKTPSREVARASSQEGVILRPKGGLESQLIFTHSAYGNPTDMMRNETGLDTETEG